MLPVHPRPLILLLFGHSLVLATDICRTQVPYDDMKREELVKAHEELRKTIAEGNLPNLQGTLPPAKNMYTLIYDCKMEEEVQKELAGCSGHATLSEKYGQNYLVVPRAYMAADVSNRLKAAIAIWQGPQTYYGLKNFSNYDDNRLYTFANMVHAKTLRFACGYKDDCGAQGAELLHISCIYNLMISEICCPKRFSNYQ
ncbi:SCP-like protein [Ancylostoma caninum]|uniref:SCP-like protein n=1 Tax=Ancylostoma caninum TaxID=29170 RepID=A0A368FNY1_ANCCA|nr:SCP-like protein [Ancylostoma caninum]